MYVTCLLKTLQLHHDAANQSFLNNTIIDVDYPKLT